MPLPARRIARTLKSIGRSSGSWIILQPRLPGLLQWLVVVVVPTYSGGPATEFHRVPRGHPTFSYACNAPTKSPTDYSLWMNAELILGGARSGKSALAERRAIDSGLNVIYIATACETGDTEMAARIAHHRARRPSHWQTEEEPLQLAARLHQWAAPDRLLLVDCLTLWLTNLMLGLETDLEPDRVPGLEPERQQLLDVLPALPGRIILVSNEVGWGIVPMNELSRRFADEQGRLNQAVAAVCSKVTLVAAGLPLELKPR